MDDAILGAAAGLAGAVIGAAGAVASAAVTGRRQARGEQEQWRRDVRRTAYVGFINACRTLVMRVGDLHGSVLTARGTVPAAEAVDAAVTAIVTEKWPDIVRAMEECGNALSGVELEGSPAVARTALSTKRALYVLAVAELERCHPMATALARTLVGGEWSTLEAVEPELRGTYRDQMDTANRLLDQFTTKSREALDA
ncbi:MULTISPECIES: hypothetical protein [unclassified Streptomyces]|uniref:hypothetical protein n=1 Tax=unclassified Streptomyces TaxID=2593676 RepID=UPI0009693241|nr:hypothetical protein [Streptomyces sp. CB01883]OKJ87279.1 hypothetical protein AMK32_08555 [Streptomyces sp. CB01883]